MFLTSKSAVDEFSPSLVISPKITAVTAHNSGTKKSPNASELTEKEIESKNKSINRLVYELGSLSKEG